MSAAKRVQRLLGTARHVVALIALMVSPFSGPAVARATPRPLPPLPNPTIERTAVARNVSIGLDCHVAPVGGQYPGETLSCDVHIQLELIAGASGARLYVPEATSGRTRQYEVVVGVAGGTRIWLDGREVGDDVSIRPGQRATLAVRYTTRPSPIRSHGRPPPLFRANPHPHRPVDARHLVLGEGWRFDVRPYRPSVLYMTAYGTTIEGPVRLDVSLPPGTFVLVGGEQVTESRELAALPSHIQVQAEHEDALFAHGGPAIILGGLMRTDNAPTRFILGVGYELSLADHFLLSAWVETDFESIQEALLVEVAAPAFMFLPSVAAGVGVVSTQLGDRGVDVGLRLRATVAFYALGFVADFDYFGLSGGWNIALAARASL